MVAKETGRGKGREKGRDEKGRVHLHGVVGEGRRVRERVGGIRKELVGRETEE